MAIWHPTAEIKYWWNLNLAICNCEAKFHYVILACGYAIHMIRPSRNLAEIKFGGAVSDRQTAKLNSSPNFPAIRYIAMYRMFIHCMMGLGPITWKSRINCHEGTFASKPVIYSCEGS